MNIEPVPLMEMLPRILHLLPRHAEEIPLHSESGLPDLNTGVYQELEEAQSLLTLAVTDKNDEVIGYSVNIIVNHPHYSGMLVAMNDALFLDKPYRKGRLGLQLIQATEDYARKRGAKLMLWPAKTGSTLAKLLTVLRYNAHEINFIKEL